MEQTVLIDKPKVADSPARRVIRLFGEAEASIIVGLTPQAVRKWVRRRGSGGLGGLIPCQYQHRFLRLARDRGLALTADDLIAEPVE